MLESFAKLKGEADLVLVEGAGSAAEINLRDGDIANMGFARAADCPVVLVGDIDRGGIFAQILGTKAALAAEDAAMIVGFIVNKFRGDPSLFTERHGDAGRAHRLARLRPCSRSFPPPRACRRKTRSASPASSPAAEAPVTIAVPMLSRIANFDDFDPLRLEPGVRLVFVRPGEPLPVADLVILPGSKATIADLAFFRAQGWDIDLMAHVRRGGRVLGICGGYQMLGTRVADREGIEGPPGAVEGLGLLDVETILTDDKTLERGRGRIRRSTARPFVGYEMHVGRTDGPDCARPLLRFADGRVDGAVSADGRVAGAYVHGLFANDRQRAAWLASLGGGVGAGVRATVEANARRACQPSRGASRLRRDVRRGAVTRRSMCRPVNCGPGRRWRAG